MTLPLVRGLTLLAVVFGLGLGQNLQLHYDLLRRHLTSTLEIYKTDAWGAIFGFIDFDYNQRLPDKVRNVSGAYGEIARYVTLRRLPHCALTLQYNDGLTNAGSFNPVWLGGLQYGFKCGKIDWPVDCLLRREMNTRGLTWQITSVWLIDRKKYEISGYLDIWNTSRDAFPARKIVVQAEPQFWYKINAHCLMGGEIEVAWNFNGAWSRRQVFATDRLFVLPTVGIKWYL